MSIKPVQNQFNGGEISPLMDGRFDLPAYQYAAEALINNIPILDFDINFLEVIYYGNRRRF